MDKKNPAKIKTQKTSNARQYKLRKIAIVAKQNFTLVLAELMEKYIVYFHKLKWNNKLQTLVDEFNQLYEPDYLESN